MHIPMPKMILVGVHDFTLVDEEDFDNLSKHKWQLASGHVYRILKQHECEKRGVPKKTWVAMHREIMSAPDGMDVDHKNCNGIDNRKCNLRLATSSQNCAWSRKRLFAKPNQVTTSKYKGVSFRSDRHRWTAYCGTGRDRAHLGCFATEEEAALAYNKEALSRYGEFARLNEV